MNWQVLYVDDDTELAAKLKEFFEGEDPVAEKRFEVTIQNTFDDALTYLETHRVDLLILDVREGSGDTPIDEQRGKKLMEAVKKRRFIPIIFYTAAAELVKPCETPLTRVVSKDEGAEGVFQVAKEILETKIPDVNRALIAHFEEVQRQYLWEFVDKHWENVFDRGANPDLAYLLARRMAMSLSGSGIESLEKYIGEKVAGAAVGPISKDMVHPLRMYIIPSLEGKDPEAGDIYRGTIQGREGYWILLTPSCDMVSGRCKADQTILAQCNDIKSHSTYVSWAKDKDKYKDKLKTLISNRAGDRNYFLPANPAFSDLVVDLQYLVTIDYKDLGGLERIASLDSPFAEELQVRFGRYYGRVGSPDVDPDFVIKTF